MNILAEIAHEQITEIIDNHDNLDRLFALLKHYGVNAEFITGALLNEFENLKEEGENENDSEDVNELVEDLNQFYARF